ncbi:MAG: tRNA pseudouridine(38-40) synthase TruA [Phycisphaerales bacterium]|nr:tRNA pseudouridine(38-40) synthase TruA [Phycisphaerales bacterium]
MTEPRRFRMVLAYDGTDFSGWQRQIGVRTVQQQVEHTIARIVWHHMTVTGASRTDAGVHARGQVAHFDTSCDIPDDRLRYVIGARLPEDITLVDFRRAEPRFHAIRDAVAKLYCYRVFVSTPNATRSLANRGAWHVWHPLDLDALRDAAGRLVGRHDFNGFAGRGSPRENTVRTIHRFDIRRRFEELHFEVCGDGFLFKQVRNMVGTLVEIGRGHWRPERIDEILSSCDRMRAGPTAPPQGLCLEWIRYPRGG